MAESHKSYRKLFIVLFISAFLSTIIVIPYLGELLGDFLKETDISPLSFFQTELPVWWKGLMGAIYGGINEEIIYRLGLTTFLAWLIYKLKVSRKIAIWSSIIIVAILFGLSHLPTTAALTPITTIIFIRAILLNGIGGVVFGYLYWKFGLETAILSHFTADIVLHVIMPLIA